MGILFTKAIRKGKRIFLRTDVGLIALNILHKNKKKYTCPICNYRGVLLEASLRDHCICPRCGSAERHRLQYLVMQSLRRRYDFSRMSIVHFAPEPFTRNIFRNWFCDYVSADLSGRNVDIRANLINLPFKDSSFDFVFASHILEHIKDDRKALSEIRRILKPAGLAVLMVPIVAEKTVEYPEPNLHDSGHVRAPGFDYFDRYLECFSRIEKFDSSAFPKKYQLFVYDDRTRFPNVKVPLRPSMKGDKHLAVVPVCFCG